MDHEIVIDWIGGNCPVQAEGMIAGKKFYFRARGNTWSMSIGGDVISDPEWQMREQYGDDPFAAGWMVEETARAFIYEAAERYLKEMADGREF